MTEFKNKAGTVVGQLKGKVFHTTRKPNHFMKMFQGFGISEDIITSLAFNGCEAIKIIYEGKDKKVTYYSPIDYWLRSKATYTYKGRLSDDVPDKQIFLSVNQMEEIE